MRSPLGDIEGQAMEQNSGSKTAKYLTVVGSLVAVGFVALTTYQNAGTTPSASASTSNLATKSVSTFKARAAVPTYDNLDEDSKTGLFNDFSAKFERSFKNEADKLEKFTNFKKFLKRVDENNAKEANFKDGAIHGITRFADYSEEEFKSLLGFKKGPDLENDHMKHPAKIAKYTGDVTSVDWSGIYTTDVKDQGYCGSCWAFSATEQIESDAIRGGLIDTDTLLSPQQIVSCDSNDAGCDGGNPVYAYYYVYSNGGQTCDDAYPYTSYYDVSGDCTSNWNPLVTITGYSMLSDEDSMVSYVLTTGPLSVCVDASDWYSYTSGILSSCGSSIDHCVQAVGVNTDDNYWKVRNSWGTSWGESGYIRLNLYADTCGITYLPTYVDATATSYTDCFLETSDYHHTRVAPKTHGK